MYPRRDARSGLYGYWGSDGWVIDPQFNYAQAFLCGYAAVSLADGHSGLIGRNGEIFPLIEVCGGRTPVREEFTYFTGFHDYNSEPSQMATVCTINRGRREWGVIDTSLTYTPLPDKIFSTAKNVSPFGEYVLFARARERGGESVCGLFHLGDMRLEIPANYSCIYPSRESLWVVSRPKGKNQEKLRFAFYDPSQREFLPGWFWGALPFSCGFGAIREEDGPAYFVDASLQPAFDSKFDEVGRFSCGLAAVYEGDDAGYIDTTGQMRLLLPYERLQPFNESGLAIANRDEVDWNLDIIDRAGKAQVTGLETAVYWAGDFPYFEVSKNGEDLLFDMKLDKIF